MVIATPHSFLFGLTALVSLLTATFYALSPPAFPVGPSFSRAPGLFWLLGAVAAGRQSRLDVSAVRGRLAHRLRA